MAEGRVDRWRKALLRPFLRRAGTKTPRQGGRRRHLRRVSIFVSTVLGGLVVAGLAAASVFVILLARGPIEMPILHDRLSQTIQHQFESRGHVSIGRIFLARGQHGPTLRIENFVLGDMQDRQLVTAPVADISIAPLALLTGHLALSGLEFSGLEVKLAILDDGSFAFSAGNEEAIALPKPSLSPQMQPQDIASTIFAVTAQDSPFMGDLQHIGLYDARLQVEDRRNGSMLNFANLNFALDRLRAGGIHLRSSADGNSGPFSVDLVAQRQRALFSLEGLKGASANSTYAVEFETRNLPVHQLQLMTGAARPQLDIAMPLSAKASAQFHLDGSVERLSGNFTLGSGTLLFDDPDAKPVAVDRIAGAFAFDPKGRTILISSFDYLAGATHFNLSGHARLDQAENTARLSLLGRNAVLADDKDGGNKPTAIDFVSVDASASLDGKLAKVERFVVRGADIDAQLALELTNSPEGQSVKGSVNAVKTRFRPVFRLWPNFIAPEVEQWLQEHVGGATADRASLVFNLNPQDLRAARAKQAVTDGAFTGDISVSNGTLSPLPGLPAFTGIEGTAHLTGTSVQFIASKAQIESSGRKIQLSDVKFTVPDSRPQKLVAASLTGRIQGSVEAAVDLLQSDALRHYNNIPGQPSQYKGQIDGQIDIGMKLGKTATPDDISVNTDLTASGLSVDKVLGNERLESANLAIVTSKDALSVKGDGRMFGAPVSLEMKKLGNAPTDAMLNFTIDDATRAKRGINFGPGFSGPMMIKAVTQLADGEHPKGDTAGKDMHAQIDVDLSKTSIDGLLPGWTKLAGKPGHASFAYVQTPNGARLEQFQLDAGNATLRGMIDLGPDNSFMGGKFTTFRLSAQDDLKLDIQKEGNVLKLTGHASVMDARPFISDMLAHSRAKSGDGFDYDLDLKVGTLAGFNKEHVQALDLKLVRRANLLRKVIVAGKLGNAPLHITTQDSPDQPVFTLVSDNAGAVLSFLDMYRRMSGGKLSVAFKPGLERTVGNVQIQNFFLDDEPALKPLLNQATGDHTPDGKSRVRFARLQGTFDRSDGRIDLKDAAMWGRQIGATMEGVLDYGQDRVDLAGNLIPAYQINNLFSKIPLFGPLLGGGANEGLFAINYRITGKASAPILRVDPLSAIAPGILRKIMGVADGTQSSPDNLAPGPSAPQPAAPGGAPSAPLDLTNPPK